MTRAISSVVDATIFLLLVGGAIGTLAGATGPAAVQDRDAAAESARILATSTASVNYTVPIESEPGRGFLSGSAGEDEIERTAHGTLASLLADAAVSNLTVEGREVSPGSDRFGAAVRTATWRRVNRPRDRTEIVARWVPYAGGPVEGAVSLGSHPPPDVDVRAATVTTAGAIDADVDDVASAGRSDGFDGVARVYASAVLGGLFPPNATRSALRESYPADSTTAQRYRRMGDVLGVDDSVVGPESLEAVDSALVDALADRFETDLRDRYSSPTAVEKDHSGRDVRITVRTWSR